MPVQDSYVTLSVDFTASPGTDTAYMLERATTATGPWTTLGQGIPLLAEQAVYTDTTAPIGVPLFYRATGNVSGTVLTFEEPAVPFTGQAYLKDPLRPWADIELDFCDTPSSDHTPECTNPDPEFVWAGLGQGVWDADAGLFPILNAEYPADIWARRKFETNQMRFLTRTLDAIDRVYELFTAGGPLLLQLPPIYGWDDHFIQPGTVTRDYTSRDQRRPARVWNVPFVVVDRPLGPGQGTQCANWCAVADAFPTYAYLGGVTGTFEDLLAGDILCPDTPPEEDGFGIGPFGDGPFGDGG